MLRTLAGLARAASTLLRLITTSSTRARRDLRSPRPVSVNPACPGLYEAVLTCIVSDEEEESHSWPEITREMLKQATTHQLEMAQGWIRNELHERIGVQSTPPSANKRRRVEK